jgi:7,8-dihydropterin-6-yl-methyl-4-(beta-D-ribofuranosyl)aminobenzene 5'-phosphate synthase
MAWSTSDVPELDELSITILVDNATDSLSSVAPGVPQRSELATVLATAVPSGQHDGHDCIAVFDRFCLACHGFSALATARRGERTASVLFDVGPYGDIWLTNAERLSIDLSSIDTLESPPSLRLSRLREPTPGSRPSSSMSTRTAPTSAGS